MELQVSNSKLKAENSKLKLDEIASLIYHEIFDYPLTQGELIKWKMGHRVINRQSLAISHRDGFYFLNGREGLVYKRLLRKRVSERKLKIAKLAVKILHIIPTIKMIGVTGALAMGNASEESDIDLMIITKKNSLWLTRLCVYCTLYALHFKLRRPADSNQRDALCLNMWLDESSLTWSKKDRNIYTAHEIAQIIPLVNKDKTYEKFLYKNKWILDWWPNSVRVTKLQSDKVTKSREKFSSVTLYLCNFFASIIERLAFKLQYFYMKSKMTREVVTPTRAIFHPNNWGKFILSRLGAS